MRTPHSCKLSDFSHVFNEGGKNFGENNENNASHVKYNLKSNIIGKIKYLSVQIAFK